MRLKKKEVNIQKLLNKYFVKCNNNVTESKQKNKCDLFLSQNKMFRFPNCQNLIVKMLKIAYSKTC